ncbi:thioredoxin domain-containing protein [uncultured Oscillibacter sp.]|uniref:thioredoxin domain-containing protein n=1 Tax=uncultured Oscillibacter sp. TaxID=876091 RepID=UPI002610BCF9|nr:thioredoxin domain-containing protein [uncultured Oscillibacter sp.]
MPNHLQHETSPYLLQHAENPVDWYPWSEEAFQRAREEDKPVFLSIGYSACHWCHVMAHESFEDPQTAALLNRWFISVKVDREERPDLDSVYMAVCQAFTGGGGWPASIFLTPEKRPFFAGTYFPKRRQGGQAGFGELLTLIHERWEHDRASLLGPAEEMISLLSQPKTENGKADPELLEEAVGLYRRLFDRENGGFGGAPKFPSPHNLLFLLAYYGRRGDRTCLEMAERTLTQMVRGGLFDHIGGGFCRYSTDERFLVPHFEKMLYDNALLILAYCQAYSITQRRLYLLTAERTADFVLREMTAPEGGFFSAQDADSDGEEGKYYLFTPGELVRLLGAERGGAFNRHFDITEAGNFEGKSIPNLLHSEPENRTLDGLLETVYQYRKSRCSLRLDDKILAAWNGLMIAALCRLYQAGGNQTYLDAAKRADRFLWESLWDGEAFHVSFQAGRRGEKGFLDDYAACIFAQLALYGATLERVCLSRAEELCRNACEQFQDREHGGFYLYSEKHETLILRPKETYDGAMPSGNSLMAWNLARMSQLVSEERYGPLAERQLDFLSADASQYPAGYAMFLLALLDRRDPPPKVTAVCLDKAETARLPLELPAEAAVILREPGEEYPMKNGRTTFHVCRGHSCLPPVNGLPVL